ncbi:uncharacterized protein TRAVEDRAFT_123493 [Trametes versicolor FP-101664 SS1]|uniref:uncharacterized protein n=1 Tax=Trametes versicolor (strain FP-101664) TaxID=717944 RepID=UPI0004621305|nr:uncharacterized protein TRAVEDRAFT_123493 [Trametes versicolor FP-101664 SS1]EIW59003.1 hypothetical protein TRAVEDRAFT_123493 [Trametes versicolor FP-101664 SS1]
MGLPPYSAGGSGLSAKAATEKQARRHNGKACDQCRKTKIKCEQSSSQKKCTACATFGKGLTECTSLRPWQKRGPVKGRISGVEVRLHQAEALIGILLSSNDSRAKSVLDDLAQDLLAKEIIDRVDESPYGSKGRSRGVEAPTSGNGPAPDQRDGNDNTVRATHPSKEWQDQVINRLNSLAGARSTLLELKSQAGSDAYAPKADDPKYPEDQLGSLLSAAHAAPPGPAFDEQGPQALVQAQIGEPQRQQRPLCEHNGAQRSTSTALSQTAIRRTATDESVGKIESDEGEDEIAVVIGQLSINEDEQVRFHGKASGLHMLGVGNRQDGRNDGDIWRFPKVRVRPPLPPTMRSSQQGVGGRFTPRLPNVPTQELLLDLYFTYVHPVLPIVHKQTFLDDFRNDTMYDSPYSGESEFLDATASLPSAPSPLSPRKRHVSRLLLLVMFSLAARHSSHTAGLTPPEDGMMWTADDEYMEDAMVILDRQYLVSRPSTCQALLLLGYREVGIGAMAQAWMHIGMAVRMAQDLGLHKSAEKWATVGHALFSCAELQERRRIWHGCVIMDKHVCTYIGRPVAISEHDFDTELPQDDDLEEMEYWRPHNINTLPVISDLAGCPRDELPPAPGRVLSSFNELAKLSVILSQICQSIYAIKPSARRPAELVRLDKMLKKWFLDLPEHLRFDPAAPKSPPPTPNILALHMQYWCTVLLLHRPLCLFISSHMLIDIRACRDFSSPKYRQHYDLSVQAANHITLIASLYDDYYSPSCASVFLCYHIFTAATMHVATLRTYLNDPQACLGLQKCLEVLQRISVIWPGAWCTLELLRGAKEQLERPTADALPFCGLIPSPRNKCSAQEPIIAAEVPEHSHNAESRDWMVYRQPTSYPVATSLGQSHDQVSQAPTGQGYMLLTGLPLQGGSSSYMLPSYDRWEMDALSNNESLSISVPLQHYGTGLIEERMGSCLGQSAGYQQYWNDDSTLGQIEKTYGMPVTGGTESVHGDERPGDALPMYIPALNAW